MVVALPDEVEYGNLLETNDLVLGKMEWGLECGTSEGLVARGVAIVVVERDLRLGHVAVVGSHCRVDGIHSSLNQSLELLL